MEVLRREREWGRHAVQVRSALPWGGRCYGVGEVGIIRIRDPHEIVFEELDGLNIVLVVLRE